MRGAGASRRRLGRWARRSCPLVCALAAACTTPVRRPPGMPPSPESITRERPGGDAYEPHVAALDRQLEQPWGWRNDKDDQVHFPLPDWENWRRVRIRFVDHLAAFRYGDDRHVFSAAFVVRTPDGEAPTSAACMAEFERQALDRASSYRVRYTPVSEHASSWRREPLVVHATDGELSFFFTRYDFSAAWAAYPAYEDGCLVYAVVVQWEGQRELARRVRDRWIEEGFSGLTTLTKTRPFRREE